MDLLQSNVPTLAELLDDGTLSVITGHCRWQRYRPGQLIHHRGEQTHGFSLIRSGHVNGSNVGLDGSTVTTSILGPGQCYGEFTLFAGLPRTHDLVALDDVEIGTIPERAFLQLVDAHPSITRALLTIALRRSHVLLEFLDNLRRLPLDMRVAKLLLAQVGQDTRCRVECRQEDLALTLGVTRASIGAVLARLEDAGLIERGYAHVVVPDQAALAIWVGERELVVPLRAGATPTPAR